LVLGHHMVPCPPKTSLLLHRMVSLWAKGGWVGVDLFFVLSGFLVSGLLFREQEKYSKLDLKRFLIRRGFKIYPPFWLLIAITTLVGFFCHQDVPLRALASELLFVQNYGPAMWNHTWSLAVEEHFYLLLAIGTFALANRSSVDPFRMVPFAFLGVATLCLLLRIINATHASFDYPTHLYPSHLRLDALLFGVALSYYFHRFPLKFLSFAQRFRFLLLAVGVLSLFPAFWFPLASTRFIYTYGLTLFYFGSGCLLVAALGLPAPRSRFGNAIAYTGSHSYSLYLWHMPVALWGIALVAKLLPRHYNWGIYCFVYLAGSIAFGIVMAVLIEFPILHLRDHLFPSRGTPLSTDATGPNNAMQRIGSAVMASLPPRPSSHASSVRNE
jgi:peptidoglycan/LPS O-acetylase OafA/YrhL